MKALPIIFLYVATITVIRTNFLETNEKSKFSLSNSFESVTNKLLESEREVFIFNFDMEWTLIDSIILKSLKNKNIPFRLLEARMYAPRLRRFFVNSSMILTLNSWISWSTFHIVYADILNNKFAKRVYFFVFCMNCTIEEISSLKVEPWKTLNIQYFMVNEQNSVKLVTFQWYSPVLCNELHLFEVNRFSKDTGKWQTPNFIIEKFNNLHGCPFTMVYSSANEFELNYDKKKPAK